MRILRVIILPLHATTCIRLSVESKSPPYSILKERYIYFIGHYMHAILWCQSKPCYFEKIHGIMWLEDTMKQKWDPARINHRIKRVNLFAGPGAGKSTLAAWIFAQLKMDNVNAEHVQEYVKGWTFLGQPPQSFDQMYILGKQMHREDIILRSGGASCIVTESPLFLGTCYAMHFKTPGWPHLVAMVDEFEKAYPSLNIFIDRKNLKYKALGRFQKYDSALEMDNFIKSSLKKRKLEFHCVPYDELDTLKAVVYEGLGVS